MSAPRGNRHQRRTHGTTTSVATNVTVNTLTALLYGDATFARTNVSLSDGLNSFTAIAQDSYGRTDTNTVNAWLPTAAPMKYDLNGNLTDDSRRVFVYDDENQLISVIVTNASGSVTKSEFAYDGKLRRRIRREYALASGLWNPVSEVRYIYDGMLVVQERHFAPQISTNRPQQLVTYTRGRDLSGTLEGAGGIGGLLARTEQPASGIGYPASALYHADGNGNVTCLIGTNSVVLARYLYDPYGNILSQSGSLADANLYRFSSKEWHGASGLVYYGYRFYAPEVQRWLSRDPIAEAGGLNMFCYAANGVPSTHDAFGLAIFWPPPPSRIMTREQNLIACFASCRNSFQREADDCVQYADCPGGSLIGDFIAYYGCIAGAIANARLCQTLCISMHGFLAPRPPDWRILPPAWPWSL